MANQATAKLKVAEKKDKKMASSIVTPEVENESTTNVGIYQGKVSRTIKDLEGNEVKKEATYSVPNATSLEEMNDQQGGKENEVLFWYNLARRLMARQQVFAALANQFTDEKVNDLHKQYEQAVEGMMAGSKDEERLKRYRAYILNEPQFEPLVQAMKNVTGSTDKPHFDFGQLEIKKPSGKPGAKSKKDKEAEAAGESDE